MALAVPKVSLRDYLNGEESSDRKHEYLDGEVFEMEAASIQHMRIAGNIFFQLKSSLKGSGCEAIATPRTATGQGSLYTYPDIIVVCGKIQTWPVDRNTIANPRVIIEVLSKSTEGYDRGRKFDSYCALPSFVEYLTVAQDSPWIMQHVLVPEGKWQLQRAEGMDAVLRFASVPAELALRDVYDGVEFEPAELT